MKYKKKIKIAFIGLGRVFEHYLFILNKIDKQSYEICALCDKNEKKIAHFKKKIKTRYFSKIQDIIKSNVNPDVVFILTPSGNHYEHSYFFLKNNINVITEKPITLKIHHANKLIKYSKKKKLMYGAVFQNRYNLPIKFAKKIIQKNQIGKITGFSVSVIWCRYQNYYEDEWHGSWKLDGGVVSQQAIHHLDAINWLIGPIKEVNALKTNAINKLQAEDTMVSLIKNKSGVLGTFQATTAARPEDLKAEILINGSKGSILINGVALNNLGALNLKNYKNLNKKKYSQKVPSGYGLGHIEFIKEVIKSLRLGKNIVPPIDPVESLHVQKIIHALYLSSENKKWVIVNNKNSYKKLG